MGKTWGSMGGGLARLSAVSLSFTYMLIVTPSGQKYVKSSNVCLRFLHLAFLILGSGIGAAGTGGTSEFICQFDYCCIYPMWFL